MLPDKIKEKISEIGTDFTENKIREHKYFERFQGVETDRRIFGVQVFEKEWLQFSIGIVVNDLCRDVGQ